MDCAAASRDSGREDGKAEMWKVSSYTDSQHMLNKQKPLFTVIYTIFKSSLGHTLNFPVLHSWRIATK